MLLDGSHRLQELGVGGGIVNLGKQLYSCHLLALGRPTSCCRPISLTVSVVGVLSAREGRQPGGYAWSRGCGGVLIWI